MNMVSQKDLLNKFLSSVKLPASPEVVASLIKTIDDDDFHLSKVTSLIAKDPSITATVLRQANSARYGLATKVSNIDDAIRLLGFNTIRSVAIGAGVVAAFPVAGGLNKSDFWRSSEVTAELCHKIATKVGADKSLAWLVGFMVRVGEIIIAQHDEQVINQIEMLPRPPGARWSREHTILGLTEGEIIGELASMWNFPDVVVVALSGSADPLSEQRPFHELSAIAHIAGILSDASLAGIREPKSILDLVETRLLQELGLSSECVLDIYGQVSPALN